ncbi:MAG TPA: hypothetical protein VK327_05555 [Candidatus Paceibacterota bacterium]|nr:hypothetical protein [Candidatus Paceibacterota bacterium]
MKQHSKLSSTQQQQQITEQRSQQQAARDFATAEELLRFDAAQTPVPPAIADRLAQSAAGLPKPGRSWWKRLFD